MKLFGIENKSTRVSDMDVETLVGACAAHIGTYTLAWGLNAVAFALAPVLKIAGIAGTFVIADEGADVDAIIQAGLACGVPVLGIVQVGADTPIFRGCAALSAALTREIIGFIANPCGAHWWHDSGARMLHAAEPCAPVRSNVCTILHGADAMPIDCADFVLPAWLDSAAPTDGSVGFSRGGTLRAPFTKAPDVALTAAPCEPPVNPHASTRVQCWRARRAKAKPATAAGSVGLVALEARASARSTKIHDNSKTEAADTKTVSADTKTEIEGSCGELAVSVPMPTTMTVAASPPTSGIGLVGSILGMLGFSAPAPVLPPEMPEPDCASPIIVSPRGGPATTGPFSSLPGVSSAVVPPIAAPAIAAPAAVAPAVMASTIAAPPIAAPLPKIVVPLPKVVAALPKIVASLPKSDAPPLPVAMSAIVAPAPAADGPPPNATIASPLADSLLASAIIAPSPAVTVPSRANTAMTPVAVTVVAPRPVAVSASEPPQAVKPVSNNAPAQDPQLIYTPQLPTNNTTTGPRPATTISVIAPNPSINVPATIIVPPAATAASPTPVPTVIITQSNCREQPPVITVPVSPAKPPPSAAVVTYTHFAATASATASTPH